MPTPPKPQFDDWCFCGHTRDQHDGSWTHEGDAICAKCSCSEFEKE